MPESGDAGVLLLDTHIIIWLFEGTAGKISNRVVRSIERARESGRVLISIFSVWEIAMLEVRGRITLSQPVEEWAQTVTRAGGVRLLDLTPDVVIDSTRLPGPINDDPADRILVASARRNGARLVTCDANLIRYGAEGHVNVADARR